MILLAMGGFALLISVALLYSVRSRNHTSVISARPAPIHRCARPNWLARRRMNVVIGTEVICISCGQEWRWSYDKYGDGKLWSRVSREVQVEEADGVSDEEFEEYREKLVPDG